MPQENEIGVEEQLKAFQTSYREMLSSRYGLDPSLANAIPLGTAQEMEEQAQALQSASGRPNPVSTNGGTGKPFSRTPLAVVESLMGQKYKGPIKQTTG